MNAIHINLELKARFRRIHWILVSWLITACGSELETVELSSTLNFGEFHNVAVAWGLRIWSVELAMYGCNTGTSELDVANVQLRSVSIFVDVETKVNEGRENPTYCVGCFNGDESKGRGGGGDISGGIAAAAAAAGSSSSDDGWTEI